jgi:hypothetical protein
VPSATVFRIEKGASTVLRNCGTGFPINNEWEAMTQSENEPEIGSTRKAKAGVA